jgi:hypothetical protein
MQIKMITINLNIKHLMLDIISFKLILDINNNDNNKSLKHD